MDEATIIGMVTIAGIVYLIIRLEYYGRSITEKLVAISTNTAPVVIVPWHEPITPIIITCDPPKISTAEKTVVKIHLETGAPGGGSGSVKIGEGGWGGGWAVTLAPSTTTDATLEYLGSNVAAVTRTLTLNGSTHTFNSAQVNPADLSFSAVSTTLNSTRSNLTIRYLGYVDTISVAKV